MNPLPRNGLLGIAFAIIICTCYYMLAAKNVTKGRESPVNTRSQSADVLKVPAGFAWERASKRELEGYASYFSSKPSRKITKIETLVAEGETVITEGYESSPGVFIFSGITPKLIKGENGESAMAIDIQTTKVTLDGTSSALLAKQYELKRDKVYLETVMGTNDRNHRLTIRADTKSDFPLIRMSAEAGVEKIK